MPLKIEDAIKDIIGQTKPTGLKEALEALGLNTAPASLANIASAIANQSVGHSPVRTAPLKLASDALGKLTPIHSTNDVGVMVRDARKRMKLSQQQLADLAGVGRRFISELEGGKPTLEFNRVTKVCAACGIDFFGGLRSEKR